jgi:hypothetical protein
MEFIYIDEGDYMIVFDGRTVSLDEDDLQALIEGEVLTSGEVSVSLIRSEEFPIEKKKIATFGTSYHVYVTSSFLTQGIEEVFLVPVKKVKK